MSLHKIRYQRAPGTLRLERVELAREAPPPHPAQEPPLPMRPNRRPPAPPPTRHQRIMAVVTPRQPVTRVPRGPVRATGAQLLRARALQQGLGRRGHPRLSQRDLALQLHCSRSALAEAERGLRTVLPNVGAWVESVLREHGEWTEPEPDDQGDTTP